MRSASKRVVITRTYPESMEDVYFNLLVQVVKASSDQSKAQRQDGIADPFPWLLKAFSLDSVITHVANIAQELKKGKVDDLLPLDPSLSPSMAYDFYGTDAETVQAIETWTRENVQLIKSIPHRFQVQVAEILQQGILTGASRRQVELQLATVTDMTIQRARLIARNEIGNLNGQIEKAQALKMGATQYIWRTSQDERVRGNPSGRYPKAVPSHHHREGKTYSLAHGAGGSDPHPASGILCRCTMEIIIAI